MALVKGNWRLLGNVPSVVYLGVLREYDNFRPSLLATSIISNVVIYTSP